MARRNIGFFLTVLVMFVAGYQLAWHRDVINRLGGIGGLLGAALFICLGFLAIFWPDRWSRNGRRGTNGRRLVTAGALVAFLFGGEFIRKALVEAPFVTVIWIAGGIIVLGILYFLTVLDNTPRMTRRVNALRARLAPRPAPAPTP